MVNMHDWSLFLKEKQVTLAGMDRPQERSGFMNRFGYKVRDPVDRFGHMKVSDMPLRGYTGNYVGPRGKKTFEETSESGRQYGRERLAGVPGGVAGVSAGALAGSALGPLGALAGGVAGGKIGANWKDFVGRGQDNARMARMWKTQQAALKRQHARGNKHFAGRFDGKSVGNANVADYIWKPGDPFKVYTDKGSHEIQQFMGARAPLGGTFRRFLSRIIGGIPGLRDPEDIERQKARLETARLGHKSLEYYHKMKRLNPQWQMSDGDKRLVSNMMHDFYSTENPDMDPKQIAMMANGATRWDAEELGHVHAGLVQYLEDTRGGGASPPMRPSDVRDDEARSSNVGSDLREEEMGGLGQTIREVRDRRKATDRGGETFDEGGPEGAYNPQTDVNDIRELFMSPKGSPWQPLHHQGDDTSRYIPRWKGNSSEILAWALKQQKDMWRNGGLVNLSRHPALGQTAEERIQNFFLGDSSKVRQALDQVIETGTTDGDKQNAKHAKEALRQMVHGYTGTAWERNTHAPSMHEHSRSGGEAMHDIMKWMVGDEAGAAHSNETHGEYDPERAATYFGSLQPPQGEGTEFTPVTDDLNVVYEGHQGY